jgi:hypothetical protein
MRERLLPRLHGKLRDERLNGELFYTFKKARIVIELAGFVGTFRPLNRQIRSTRFLFTIHPAPRDNAVIPRYP